MADLATIIGQLFGLDPGRAPASLPAGLRAIGGSAPVAAPKVPAADNPLADSTGAKVLASLRQSSTPNIPQGGGPFGMDVGPLPDVKGKDKWGAFATGLSAGMNNAQKGNERRALAADAGLERNLKEMAALFNAQSTEQNMDLARKGYGLRERGQASTEKYQQSMAESARIRAERPTASSARANDPVTSMYNTAKTRQANAAAAGINDKTLREASQSLIPEIRDPAKAELARRQTIYDGYEAERRAAAGDPNAILKPPGAADAAPATGTPTAPPPTAAPAPAGPAAGKVVPPVAPVDIAPGKAGAAPGPRAAGEVSPAAAAGVERWVTVENDKGERMLYNPATKQMKAVNAP